ncbi:MAG: hypothetical protein JXA46_07545 [Dehalococcoidales bacterium]|nr:hypothetical protein [Dehalococcoidales bacterium]
MGRDFTEEKWFSEQLDLLLAGKEASQDLAMSDDLKSTLDFAQKMIGLRVSPSPRFASGLKAVLLQRLAEKESSRAAGLNWFQRLIPRTPAFQAVAAAALIFIIGGILWAALLRPSPSEQVLQAPAPTPPAQWTGPVMTTPAPSTTAAAPAGTAVPATIVPTPYPVVTPAIVTAPETAPAATAVPAPTAVPPAVYIWLQPSAATDKASYLPGEQVVIEVDLKNNTDRTVILEDFPPSLSLMDTATGQPVYTVNAGKIARSIGPGQSVSYVITWDQKDDKGRSAAPGSYYLEMEEVYHQGISVPLSLAGPVYFEILPSSSGAGGNVIPEGSDPSLTVNGITVTLELIEITSGGTAVTAFISPPPGYTLQEDSSGLFASEDYSLQARYSIDGNWFEQTGPSFVEYYAEGMRHTWAIPSTAAAEAEEIVLVIDAVAEWAGPWEFRVVLK